MTTAINSHEQRVLEGIRRLPPAAVKEVEDFVIFLEARSMTWSYGDPASVVRAVDLMSRDPFLRRENESIGSEFSACNSDGLEAY